MSASTASWLREHPEFATPSEVVPSRHSLNAVAYVGDDGGTVEFIDLQESEIVDPLELIIAEEAAAEWSDHDDQPAEKLESVPENEDDLWDFTL